MKNEPQEITLAEYKKLAGGKRAKKRAALLPRAESDERVGLQPLMLRGWSLESPDCVQYRLYNAALDTGMQPTLKAACDAAKRLEAQK